MTKAEEQAKQAQRQQDFNTAYTGIVKQGRDAVLDGDCQYITADGCKCAIGMLLPDEEATKWEEFSSEIGGAGIYDMIKYGRDEGLELDKFEQDEEFYSRLQSAHDLGNIVHNPNNANKYLPFLQGFEIMMKQVAEEYGLAIPTKKKGHSK